MHPVIVPYSMASASAKALADSLTSAIGRKVMRVRSSSPTHRPHKSKLYINWGESEAPVWEWEFTHRLNPHASIALAQNKLSTFEVFKQNSAAHPDWTTDVVEANEWFLSGAVVVARYILNGHAGVGIRLFQHEEGIDECLQMHPIAPLYVLYKKKKQEFRVHVFQGTVLDVQEKRREREVDRDDFQSRIRNRDNGWVFCREDIVEPHDLRDVAIAAVTALGLDFGAVDIIYNQREDQCYALEVNTAPGLEGTTLEKYTQAILEVL